MGSYTRRRFLRQTLAVMATGALGAAAVACGQPLPPAASAGATPGEVATLTPSPTLSAPAFAATQTAFAAVPTKSDVSPLAPTGVVPTLIVPTAVREPIEPTKIIPSPPPVPTYNPSAPCGIAAVGRDGVTPRLSAVTANTIVIGTVLQVQDARWSTPDGRRPATGCGGPPYYRIYTPVVVRVEQVVKGSLLSAQEIVVEAYGGSVGQDRQVQLPDTPYAVGERELLFLSTAGGTGSTTIGRYLVNATGVATNANDPNEKLPLQQLLDDIAPVLPRSTATPGAPIPATPR